MTKLAAVTAALMLLVSCGNFGRVEQGRVIAYDAQARRVTLIPTASGNSPGTLPPLTIETPTDPNEMGPEPAAGGLMLLDTRARRIVVYDAAQGAFRTIRYTPLEERRNVSKAPRAPVVDRAKSRITLYASDTHALVTFGASPELLALPADTWRSGDVVRYYYKDPARALRLMNVTRTDLTKSGG